MSHFLSTYVIHNLETAKIFEKRLLDGYWENQRSVHFVLSEIISGFDKAKDVETAATNAIGLQKWEPGLWRGHPISCRVIAKLGDNDMVSGNEKAVRLSPET